MYFDRRGVQGRLHVQAGLSDAGHDADCLDLAAQAGGQCSGAAVIGDYLGVAQAQLGNSDLMCQLLASKLKESIGVNANVSYMEGGDGTIALGSIANNTEADGYTIALCASGQFSIKPFTQDVSYEIHLIR